MIENMDTDRAVLASTTESVAVCEYPPTTADSPGNYHLDSGLRTVGQIVTAYCQNTTVAIVRCMPNLQWNATIPPCPIDDTSRDNMSTVLIVLWVVGGVLLIALIVLIVVIITSKSKASRGLGRTSSPSTSVFQISGGGSTRAGHRRSRGGDNPAFSRADEICGEWSYYRGDALPDSQRLPSYHEAIANSCMTVPVRTRPTNQQDPPTGTNSVSSPDSARHFQSLGINLRSDSDNLTESQIRTGRADTETHLEERPIQRTPNDEVSGSAADATTDQGTSVNQVSSSSDQRNAGSNLRRYADNYPRCFFEDEPPPPYSFQSTNYNPNRPAQQQQPRVSGQQPGVSGHHPSRARSMVASSSRPEPNQDEHFLPNQHFRRSMCDRLASTANTRSENGNRPDNHMHQSVASSNNGQIYSVQNDTRYNTRPNRHISQASSNARNLLLDIRSGTYPSAGLQTSRPSRPSDEHIAAHTRANHIQPPLSRLNMPQNVPLVSSVLEGHTGHVQPIYASDILDGDNRHRDHHGYNRTHVPMTHNSMHAFRSYEDTQSAMPYTSFNSSQYHGQTQPLGTSTPVTQSPAETRRFGPIDHPSPLPITRNPAFHRPGLEQPPLRCYDSEVNRRSHVIQELSSVPQSFPKDNHSFSSCSKLTDHRSAPLARFDTEYTYL